MPDAMASFNGVLEAKPTNLIALIGKVSPFELLHVLKGKHTFYSEGYCTLSGISPRLLRLFDEYLN
jgi:hypothetical protein